VVTGHSYALGDLAARATTSVWVHPTGDSGVEVSVTDQAGQVKRLPEFGYIEPGYRGWISADLTSVGVRHIDGRVELDP